MATPALHWRPSHSRLRHDLLAAVAALVIVLFVTMVLVLASIAEHPRILFDPGPYPVPEIGLDR